ncbi:MAG: hypothetical protein JWO67_2572 [Streptosporangiaceae bacterium]|nr:hypothetical protein [Streptosporangiaceae bacterium]
MRYRITTPEPGWTGQIGTVNFADGAAECEADADAAALYYFRQAGYGVEEVAEPSPAERIAALRAELAALEAQEPDVIVDVNGDGVSETLPKKSASADAWRAFAVKYGMSQEEADGLSRDDLIARYAKEDSK